jgi:hypothetical protein
VNHAAGHPEPFLCYRFPLAAGPQDIPDTVKSRPVISSRSARTSSLW